MTVGFPLSISSALINRPLPPSKHLSNSYKKSAKVSMSRWGGVSHTSVGRKGGASCGCRLQAPSPTLLLLLDRHGEVTISSATAVCGETRAMPETHLESRMATKGGDESIFCYLFVQVAHLPFFLLKKPNQNIC